MDFLAFTPHYFHWHYTRGIRDLISNAFSFVSFLATFFSLSTLFHTLFEPWQRLGEEYKKGFHPQQAASTLLINGIMRIFGFAVRLATLMFGFVIIVIAILLSVASLLLWIFFPLIIVFFLSLSLKYLFS